MASGETNASTWPRDNNKNDEAAAAAAAVVVVPAVVRTILLATRSLAVKNDEEG